MNSSTCNGYLEAMASLNEGADHVCEYTLETLEGGVPLQHALVSHFTQLKRTWDESWIKSGKQPMQFDWSVKLSQLLGDWKQPVERSVTHWFFEQGYSPEPSGDWNKHNVVQGFMNHLAECVGGEPVYEVHLTESMQPDVFWEAYAFSNQGSNFLLQFGWSD